MICERGPCSLDCRDALSQTRRRIIKGVRGGWCRGRRQGGWLLTAAAYWILTRQISGERKKKRLHEAFEPKSHLIGRFESFGPLKIHSPLLGRKDANAMEIEPRPPADSGCQPELRFSWLLVADVRKGASFSSLSNLCERARDTRGIASPPWLNGRELRRGWTR